MVFMHDGSSWLWMALLMGSFYALVVGIVILATRAVIHNEQKDPRDVEEILEERFARGEIDEQEFETKRRTLRAA